MTSIKDQIRKNELERENSIFLNQVCLILKYKGIRKNLPRDEGVFQTPFQAIYEDDSFLIIGEFGGLRPSYQDWHGLDCVNKGNIKNLKLAYSIGVDLAKRVGINLPFNLRTYEKGDLKDVLKEDFSSSAEYVFNELYSSVHVMDTSQSFEESGGLDLYPNLKVYKEFRKETYNLGDDYLNTLEETIERIKFEAWSEGYLHLFGVKTIPTSKYDKHSSHGKDSLVVATAYK